MPPIALKRSGVQLAGEQPDELSPCSCCPSQTIANASEPIPLPVGSTCVSAMAVARAASIALPPLANIDKPACPARGCDATTMLSAMAADR